MTRLMTTQDGLHSRVLRFSSRRRARATLRAAARFAHEVGKGLPMPDLVCMSGRPPWSARLLRRWYST